MTILTCWISGLSKNTALLVKLCCFTVACLVLTSHVLSQNVPTPYVCDGPLVKGAPVICTPDVVLQFSPIAPLPPAPPSFVMPPTAADLQLSLKDYTAKPGVSNVLPTSTFRSSDKNREASIENARVQESQKLRAGALDSLTQFQTVYVVAFVMPQVDDKPWINKRELVANYENMRRMYCANGGTVYPILSGAMQVAHDCQVFIGILAWKQAPPWRGV